MSYFNIATRVIDEQTQALSILKNNLPADFERLVEHIIKFSGRIILTGIGKSGYIAHKIAASFASTGTASFYIHPAEASHGDLGMITEQDLVIMLSNSGETKELSDIINYCKRFAIKIVGMTMNVDSTLASNSDFLLPIPAIKEASLIAAPTTSALLMLALGDALTVSVQEAKGFSKDDFRLYHPGGKIGANLLKVSDLMRKNDSLPLVFENTAFSETIIIMTNKGLGCALVVDEKTEKLVGLISDGDLRRHINDKIELKYAKDVMTANPISVLPSLLASEALFIMNSKSITVLPVTKNNITEGAIHIHDILKAGVG
jgi:arabinose-5-phosphate isomerase